MPTSDEDLQKQSDAVQKLREQVADAEAKRTERERELANDITMQQLKVEEAALQARLHVAKEAGKVGNVKSGAAAPLDATRAEMERAVAQRDAAAKAGENAARATESTSTGTSSGDTDAKSGAATTGTEK